MSETAIVTDASLEETPKNAPLTDNSVDKDDQGGEDQHVDPRLAIMERIADQNNEERALTPGTRQEDMPMGEPVPDDEMIESGLASQEAIDDGEDPDG